MADVTNAFRNLLHGIFVNVRVVVEFTKVLNYS
jgi:hypothetical protein